MKIVGTPRGNEWLTGWRYLALIVYYWVGCWRKAAEAVRPFRASTTKPENDTAHLCCRIGNFRGAFYMLLHAVASSNSQLYSALCTLYEL